jgi:hypothetical protein
MHLLDKYNLLYIDVITSSQPYALALALFSIFGIFIIELIAFRWGTSKLAALNIQHGMLHLLVFTLLLLTAI